MREIMNEPNSKIAQRRAFMYRLCKTGLSVAAAAVVSYSLYDRQGPMPAPESAALAGLPDFSVPQRPGQTISIVKGADRTATLRKAVELLGGIERFVRPGETVVIKPNVAFARPPIIGSTTAPQLVAEIARLCLKARAKKVLVVDNPINDPASCFSVSGIAAAARGAGAEIILPKDSLFAHVTLEKGRLIKNWPVFYGPLGKADKLIGIAPVKDHHRAGASMTMKNWYGLLGGRRNIFHQDINTIIAELSMLVKPTLVILDGTEVMVTNGPTGGSISDLKRTNTLIASCDQVAADSFGAELLGLRTSDLPYLRKAQAAGSGTTDYESLKPLRADIG